MRKRERVGRGSRRGVEVSEEKEEEDVSTDGDIHFSW